MSDLSIYTIGHSTRSAEVFIELLRVHQIVQLADVRSFPRSRRHPHFNTDVLASFLESAGVAYRHFPALGGRRKPRVDSVNTGWRHPSFRGYADYMQTSEFQQGVQALEDYARAGRTTVMCAEAVWWQCHRQLLADALFVRGVKVWHILGPAAAKPHELSDFAQAAEGGVTYPGLL